MRRGLGKEDILHKQFANTIRGYEAYNKLNCTFWSYFPSGEKRTFTTGSLLKAKATQTGVADFFFIEKKGDFHRLTWIEFKTEKGKQTESQKEFEAKFKDDYFIARSVDEGVKILVKRGIVSLS